MENRVKALAPHVQVLIQGLATDAALAPKRTFSVAEHFVRAVSPSINGKRPFAGGAGSSLVPCAGFVSGIFN